MQDNLAKAKERGVPGVAEFYRRVQKWRQVPGLVDEDLKEYSKKRKLSEQQTELLNLKIISFETIAELEIIVDTILEMNDKEIAREINLLNGSKRSNKRVDRGPKARNDKHKKPKANYDTEEDFEDID